MPCTTIVRATCVFQQVPAPRDPSFFNNSGLKKSFTHTLPTPNTQIVDADRTVKRTHNLNHAAIPAPRNRPSNSASQEGTCSNLNIARMIETMRYVFQLCIKVGHRFDSLFVYIFEGLGLGGCIFRSKIVI